MTHFSPGLKLLLLFLIMLVATVLTSLLTGFFGWYLFGDMQFDPLLLLEHVSLLKLLQVIQTVVVFIVPALIAAKLFWPESVEGLTESRGVNLKLIFSAGITMALSQYFIGWSGSVNSQIVLPEGWSAVSAWVERTEQEAMELTGALTQYSTHSGFSLNIIIIALLPAIGEEWFFRGHVQRYFSEWFKNVHLSIFITAILFSAMHLQFMTFLPRFFLGLILGYLFYLGGNLWYSVAGHFTNNFLALMAMRGQEKLETVDAGKVPEVHFSAGVVISALAVIGMLFFISRIRYADRDRR